MTIVHPIALPITLYFFIQSLKSDPTKYTLLREKPPPASLLHVSAENVFFFILIFVIDGPKHEGIG
jgi:hypothetical protein